MTSTESLERMIQQDGADHFTGDYSNGTTLKIRIAQDTVSFQIDWSESNELYDDGIKKYAVRCLENSGFQVEPSKQSMFASVHAQTKERKKYFKEQILRLCDSCNDLAGLPILKGEDEITTASQYFLIYGVEPALVVQLKKHLDRFPKTLAYVEHTVKKFVNDLDMAGIEYLKDHIRSERQKDRKEDDEGMLEQIFSTSETLYARPADFVDVVLVTKEKREAHQEVLEEKVEEPKKPLTKAALEQNKHPYTAAKEAEANGRAYEALRILERHKKFSAAADVALRQGNYKRAVRLLLKDGLDSKAAKVAEEHGDYKTMLNILKRTAPLYAAGKAEKLGYYNIAIRILNESGNEWVAARLVEKRGDYNQAADLYRKAGCPAQAETVLKKRAKELKRTSETNGDFDENKWDLPSVPEMLGKEAQKWFERFRKGVDDFFSGLLGDY